MIAGSAQAKHINKFFTSTELPMMNCDETNLLHFPNNPALFPAPKGLVHVVDDNAGLRDTICHLLRIEGYQVRSHASAREFLNCVHAEEGGCVVADVVMPEMSGLQMLAEMKRLQLSIPVVVITGESSVGCAVEAMKLGAADFVEKPFGEGTLLAMVRAALAGNLHSPERWAEIRSIRSRVATLTPRQREVLRALTEGMPNKRIAATLGLSVRTVEFHRSSTMHMMGARNLPALVRMALLAKDEIACRSHDSGT
jgi:two-component system response regulator FixJ